jgi:hypothetical protein
MSSHESRLLRRTSINGVPPDDEESVLSVEDEIRAIDLSEESKTLIRTLLHNQVKVKISDVMGIWSIAAERMVIIPKLVSSILWVERGSETDEIG